MNLKTTPMSTGWGKLTSLGIGLSLVVLTTEIEYARRVCWT